MVAKANFGQVYYAQNKVINKNKSHVAGVLNTCKKILANIGLLKRPRTNKFIRLLQEFFITFFQIYFWNKIHIFALL